jgi:two-component system CheB/CheR fusion protein
MVPWREPAAAFGFRASAALPLRRQGNVIGAVTLYALRPGIFDATQMELLQSLSADMSYALDAMQQEQLRTEAERALRESERHKDDFLAMLSHELRNPLVPISNSLFILDRASPGGEQDRRARTVMARQVRQLTRLVDDLLDVTRISSGKLRFVKARFDLVELIRRTAEDHRTVFAQAGIEFELRAGDRPLYVDGDEARIEQVVGNLLSNSVKFTARGGRVALEVEPVVRDAMAVLRVQDTGIGMSCDMLTKLFRPFVQADVSLDRSRGGLGLGLALVKGVVELHGGRVEARSAGVGAGAEFIVWLPAEAAAAVPQRPTQASRPPPRRVLVIEDNRDAADTLREVLGFGEHQVEVATNGSEGIAKAQSFRPDVVLCDIGLPGMDGYEVARALRRDRSLDSTRLVALTGYALPEDEARAREAGFDVHLPKPPSLEDIEAVLAALPEP